MSEEGKKDAATTTTPTDETTKWKEKAQRYEAENENFRRTFKDIDPERYKALAEENRILMEERADKGGQKEKDEYKALLDKEYGGKITKAEQERDEARAEAKKFKVVIPAMSEMMKHINSDQVDFFQGLVETNCMEHEGKIVIKGADGKPRKSEKTPTEFMDLGEWVGGTLKTKYPSSFKPEQVGTGKDGGTTSTVNGKGSGLDYAAISKLSSAEQKAAFAKAGPEAVAAMLTSKH